MRPDADCPWQSASGAQSGTSPSTIEGLREFEADSSAFLQEPVFLREEGSGSGKSAGKFLKKMGIREDKLHIAARINDQESIKNLVAGGLGISIVSEKAVKDYVESRRLLQFSLPEEFSGREFYIVYQKNYILKECAGEFIRFLKMYQKNL